MKVRFGSIVILLAVHQTRAHAQLAPRTDCPVADGLIIQTTTDSTRPSAVGPTRDSTRDSTRSGLRLDGRNGIDTVWTFDIRERRWTRPYFSALIGAGWASDGRTAGTTSAPGSAAGRGWSACAGARIDMRDPTLVLRGARGRVHLRADVRSLSTMGRGTIDTTSQPRRER